MAEVQPETEQTKPDNGASETSGLDFVESTTEFFRRALIFIFYGPGVLGLLWLIGRILRR
jgi:hypothetical protein